jgi:short-chain fatty acids transporter
MIRRLGHRFAAFFRATTPDPFVLAVALTLVAFALAAIIEGQGPIDIIHAWQGDTGFFSLLAFTMQMVLILVTGHALASAPVVKRTLVSIAALPRSGAQATFLVAFVAIATAILNWGLGLVVGAILAREVGKSCAARDISAHYPLLSAAGYTGLMCWHGGFSGSAPLMMTTEANVARFLGDEMAAEVGTLSFTETVLSPMNLVVTLGLLLVIPALCAALAPRGKEPSDSMSDYLGDAGAEDDGDEEHHPETVPERIEASPITAWIIVVPLAAAFVVWLLEVGIAKLDPNALNLLFLTLGLALHGSLRRYRLAVSDAVAGTSGIVLQFPFYAGIMGVMRGTGLGTTFATAVTSTASSQTYGVLTMLSAGLINLFVPSGGGQWAVQGPIAVEASNALSVPLSRAVMAVAYGDQLTNMLQPFWALPLLAITGVKARDVIGYTTIIMIAGAIWMGTMLTVW